MTVHRMMMLAFVGPCPLGLEVCHNDGNPANNVLSNLRYDTPTSNRHDCLKHGGNPLVRLKPEDIPVIRSRLASGEKGNRIAAEYGVSTATISMVRNSKVWDHIPSQGENIIMDAHPNSRLKASDVRVIRDRLKRGESGSVLAKDYGVSQATISMIRSRKIWTHI